MSTGTASVGPQVKPETPYEVTDGILALVLYLAGGEFIGDHLWCTNTYTLDGLRRLGFKGKVKDAALSAVRASKPGIVRFLFQSKPDRALAIYNDQAKELREKDIEAAKLFDALIDQHVAGEIDREEFKARVACLLFKTRIQIMNAWKNLAPFIQIEEDGPVQRFETTAQVTDDNGRVRTVPAKGVARPGFNLISTAASEKVQKHLGIKL